MSSSDHAENKFNFQTRQNEIQLFPDNPIAITQIIQQMAVSTLLYYL